MYLTLFFELFLLCKKALQKLTMVTVVFAKRSNKKDCATWYQPPLSWLLAFTVATVTVVFSVLVETMVTIVKNYPHSWVFVLFLDAFSCPANPQIAHSRKVYNTAGVKLQLTASLLLHTRSFLAIVCSRIFFFLRSTPSLCLNAIQTFILNVCQALTVYRTKVTNAGPTPPTCYRLKRLCECVCSHTYRPACCLIFSSELIHRGISVWALHDVLMFRRDFIFACTFSGDTPTYAGV